MQWERRCQTLHAGSTLQSFENEIADLQIFWGMQGLYSTLVAFTPPVLCLFQAQASKLLKKDLARCRNYSQSILEICSFVKVVPGSYFHTSPPMENKSKCQRLFSKSSLINFELCVIGILVNQCVMLGCWSTSAFILCKWTSQRHLTKSWMAWQHGFPDSVAHEYIPKLKSPEFGFSADIHFTGIEGLPIQAHSNETHWHLLWFQNKNF